MGGIGDAFAFAWLIMRMNLLIELPFLMRTAIHVYILLFHFAFTVRCEMIGSLGLGCLVL